MDEDILVVMAGNGHVRVMKPEDGDEPVVKEMKMFLLACLHRRNLDDDFDGGMAEWFEKSLSNIKEQAPSLKH
jgi:hypothetical protein